MMKRHISLRRWLALGILFWGIVLVQSPSMAEGTASPGAPPYYGNRVPPSLGLASLGGFGGEVEAEEVCFMADFDTSAEKEE